MPIFFYIQRILLKTVIAIAVIMIGTLLAAMYFKLPYIIEHKRAYFSIAFVLYLVYLLPLSRADKFDSVGNWDPNTIDPKIKDTVIAMSAEIKKRAYSPRQAIPSLILMLLQIALLLYIIRSFLLPVIGVNF